MIIHVLIRNYYDYCDNWETELAYYKDKDLAEYLADELNKKYGRETHVSFYTKSVDIEPGILEDWEIELGKLEKEWGTSL